jgi:gamma-glutamylcyclotransferase (GGCT)/AIG2-like uncharacterized protein YtfP
MNLHQVFTYGNLMAGERLFDSRRTKVIGKATVEGRLYWNGRLPFVVLGSGGLVHGELHHVTDAELAALDRIEGVALGKHDPYWYDRRIAYITTETGETVPAFVYAPLLQAPTWELIESGDFRSVAGR